MVATPTVLPGNAGSLGACAATGKRTAPRPGRQQFTLHYQPQVCIATRQVLGIEALLRWQHPELGTVSPGEFIPIAEDSGQILAIGEWVAAHRTDPDARLARPGLALPSISVNLSAIQFL